MNAFSLLRRAAIAAAAGAVFTTSQAATLFQPFPVEKAARAPDMLVAPFSIKVDRQAIEDAAKGIPLDVDLPNGKHLTIQVDRVERHENGDVSWVGKVLDPIRDDLTAVGTTGASGTYAELQTPDATWGIVPSKNGHDWVFDKTASQAILAPRVQADDTRTPPYHPPADRAKTTCPTVAAKPTPQATVDVLAVITPDFVSNHGGAAGAETRLNNLFTSMNSYNSASNIAITYRRVATMNASYQAASTPGDDDNAALDAITQGTGSFVNVEAVRSFFGADMVALFRGPKNTTGNSISGVAWVNGDTNGNISPLDAPYMYSVNGDWTFPGATLPAHELGHNLGNNHDRPNAGTTPEGTTPYAFGHYVCGSGASATCGQAGFNDTGTGFGTIMAYQLPTVAKFSSPNLTCQGTQPGALAAPCGVDGLQDVVRSTNCIRQSVAALRSSWVGTCNLTIDSDADGIPDCIEAASGKSSGVKDNDIFTKPLLFVAQQYRDFLSRESDADGLNYWTGALASGASTQTQMIDGFITSTEFQGAIAPVARLYFAYFLRIPDYGGLQYWIGQYKSGMSLAQISQAFAASTEFATRYGALTNNQFVSLVYNNVLSRPPDAAGLTYWTGQLNTGAIDRGGAMLAFSESTEYKGLIGNEIYVTMTYMGMMRRAPDAGGFNTWVSYLDGGNTGQALISAFLASTEYHNRFLP